LPVPSDPENDTSTGRPVTETPESPATDYDPELAAGARHHEAGRFREAEQLYRRVLQRDPNNAEALNLLGVLAAQAGHPRDAKDMLSKAVAIDGSNAEFRYNLALVCQGTGDRDEAITFYRQAVEIRPAYADAWLNLGGLLLNRGEAEEAERCHRQAAALNPASPVAHHNLGTALIVREAFQAAEAAFRKALQLRPDYPEALNGLGLALNMMGRSEDAVACLNEALTLKPSYVEAHATLGMILVDLERFEEAETSVQRALRLAPNVAATHNNLGDVLLAQGRTDEAITAYRQALTIKRDFPEAEYNLGNALKQQDRLDEAVAAYRRALECRPQFPKADCNLGNALKEQGHLDEALVCYRRALAHNAGYAEARHNLALALLLLGDFAGGFDAYEARWGVKGRGEHWRKFAQPMWNGSSLDGRSLLVWGEQGVGDEIMFAGLIPEIVALGCHCVVETDPRFVPLFERSFASAEIVARCDPPDARTGAPDLDFQCPMGSLPRWLRSHAGAFTPSPGYLHACPNLTRECRARYKDDSADRVIGISWRSGNRLSGTSRTAALDLWDPCLTLPRTRFVNLQYGDCESELARVRERLGVEVYHDASVDPLTSLDDFAAQVAAMDLVISIDNTTVHMAGALGTPVWTLLPFVPEWRWRMHGSESLWYRSMTLFRQPARGAWEPLFEEIAQALAGWHADRRNAT
jgi:Flp pilus assembly protein TadD